MKKFSRFTISLLIVFICAIILFASCGNDKKKESSSNDNKTKNTDKWGGATRDSWDKETAYLEKTYGNNPPEKGVNYRYKIHKTDEFLMECVEEFLKNKKK